LEPPTKGTQMGTLLREIKEGPWCHLVVPWAQGIKPKTYVNFSKDYKKIPAHGSIYHHFWGRLLQSQFDEPEYNNDFAAWVYHGLHEKALAEHLSVIDPTDYRTHRRPETRPN